MSIHFASRDTDRQRGLLEQDTLLILSADAEGRRWIEDGNGHTVGFARTTNRWWPWGFTLAVHESFEEPVVFQVRRLWTFLPRWIVFDAEGESVGVVAPARVRDRWDRVLFRRIGGCRFVTMEGVPAAEWSEDGERGRLLLHDAVRDDPFGKMILLAAVLVS
jgi:hypothetical protein